MNKNNKMSPAQLKACLAGHQLVWGIDPGTNTGVAIWDRTRRRFDRVVTVSLVEAMDMLKSLPPQLLIVEDARTRSGVDAAKMGAGSIRRDCAIWQEFADRYNHIIWWKNTPRGKNNMTKLSAGKFKNLTGWTDRTSEHARDAAMLVWGM